MEFSNYIKELLIFNDCVILPGLGGFISKYKPAEIDPVQFSFFPPSKEIVFNAHLIHNDGLFINYVAIVNRISYLEAKSVFSNFISGLYEELDKGNTVVFQDIGAFCYDLEHNIVFNREVQLNLLADAYGLSSFNFPVVDQTSVINTKEDELFHQKGFRKILFHPLVKAAILAVPVIASLTWLTLKTNIGQNLKEKYFSVNEIIIDTLKSFQNFTEKDIYNNPNSMKASFSVQTNKYFALFYAEPKKEGKVNTVISSNNNISLDSISCNPDLKNTVISEKSIQKTLEEAKKNQKENKAEEVIEAAKRNVPFEKNDNKKPESTSVSSQQKFYLVAGSFGNIENAKYQSKLIERKGYNAEILKQENGLFRVSLKTFSNRDIATKEQISINAKDTDFTVWVLAGK